MIGLVVVIADAAAACFGDFDCMVGDVLLWSPSNIITF